MRCATAFAKLPRDGLIEAFHEEERRGTNTGGGSVEFLPENGGLYLGRTYTQRTEPARFIEETNKLGQAATYWAQEVFPAVATKVFGHGDYLWCVGSVHLTHFWR